MDRKPRAERDDSWGVRPWVLNGVAVLVMALYAGSVLYGMSHPKYHTDPTLGVLAMTVVGGIFGAQVIHKNGGKQ